MHIPIIQKLTFGNLLNLLTQRNRIIFTNYFLNGLDLHLKNELEDKKGNFVINFAVNPGLVSSFKIYHVGEPTKNRLNILRAYIYERIRYLINKMGKDLEPSPQINQGKFKRFVKGMIDSVRPNFVLENPSEKLRVFVLAHSVKELKEFNFPKYMHIALTNKCNLRCIMCPYHSKILSNQHSNKYFTNLKKMPEILLKKIIDEASQYSCSLSFGQYDEPLLYNNFVDHAAYAKEKGCKISITSNGILMTPQKAEKLISAGVDHISFSLDAASQETYTKIRGADFKIPLVNLRNLVEIRDRKKASTTIRACMVIQEHNRHETELFKNVMSKIGIDMISYYKESILDDGIWRNEIPHVEINENTCSRFACSQLWSQVMIYPDGNVSLCCASTMYVAYRENIPYMGNVADLSIADIWVSARYEKTRSNALRGIFTTNSICRDCQIWNNFMNVQTIDSDGNLVQINPYETYVTFAK